MRSNNFLLQFLVSKCNEAERQKGVKVEYGFQKFIRVVHWYERMCIKCIKHAVYNYEIITDIHFCHTELYLFLPVAQGSAHSDDT